MLYGDGIHDETQAIQTMLNESGIVRIEKPGTYLISKTLKIYSNTRFELSPGARLLAAPMSRCALIENEHFTQGIYDENIEIIGGIWDGNCDQMGLDAVYEAEHRLDAPYSPNVFKGKLIRFAHVKRLHLSKMTVCNPVSYGIQIADAYGFVVRDLFFDYNWHFGTTDGVHINGPAFDGVIENLCGTTNDDMIGMTTYDESHAEVTLGNIENISIRNVTARNGYSAIRLLSGENYSMRNIHIDGVYGTYRHHAVIISNHNDRPGKTWFDDITIENVHVHKSPTPLGEGCFRYWEEYADGDCILEFGRRAICGNVTIRNVRRHEIKTTNSALLCFRSSAHIQRLYLDNVHQTTEPNVTAPFWIQEGIIETLVERDVDEHEINT
ncbi:MAG: hypothetical protein J6D30_03575 [Clostridia bacterium]|nr:hypothetical protein [Clostridia bacterium]